MVLRFNAFANLAQAIDETCHYRESVHNETSHLLWADQICINQSNLAERSHQVGMMCVVYASARDVAVNLPTKDSPYINEACAWMTRMAAPFPMKLMNPWEGLMVWANCVNEHEHDEMDALASDVVENIKSNIEDEERDPIFLRGSSALLSALAADWWTRTWVVQEFLASQTAVFIIGQYSVNPAVLMAIKIALIELWKDDLRLPNNSLGIHVSQQWAGFIDYSHYIALANSISPLGGEGTIGMNGRLAELLDLCQFRKASDPRDEV